MSTYLDVWTLFLRAYWLHFLKTNCIADWKSFGILITWSFLCSDWSFCMKFLRILIPYDIPLTVIRDDCLLSRVESTQQNTTFLQMVTRYPGTYKKLCSYWIHQWYILNCTHIYIAIEHVRIAYELYCRDWFKLNISIHPGSGYAYM